MRLVFVLVVPFLLVANAMAQTEPSKLHLPVLSWQTPSDPSASDAAHTAAAFRALAWDDVAKRYALLDGAGLSLLDESGRQVAALDLPLSDCAGVWFAGDRLTVYLEFGRIRSCQIHRSDDLTVVAESSTMANGCSVPVFTDLNSKIFGATWADQRLLGHRSPLVPPSARLVAAGTDGSALWLEQADGQALLWRVDASDTVLAHAALPAPDCPYAVFASGDLDTIYIAVPAGDGIDITVHAWPDIAQP